MQSRALEKCVWSVSFLFCAAFLMADQSQASGLETVLSHSQNPRIYIIGLIVTFAGAKMFSGSGTQF